MTDQAQIIDTARHAQIALDALADPKDADHRACDRMLLKAYRTAPKTPEGIVDLIDLVLLAEGENIDDFITDALNSIRKSAVAMSAHLD